MATTTRNKKSIAQKRRKMAAVRLDAWRQQNANALKGWDPVKAVRKSRTSRSSASVMNSKKSVRPADIKKILHELDALSNEVTKHWKGTKDAVKAVREQRR